VRPGNSLYVGEEDTFSSFGIVRKVNLDTGASSQLFYDLDGDQSGVKDLAIAANGKALVSIQFNGSGHVPLWELDTTTDTFTERIPAIPGVSQHHLISRSADRSLMFLHSSNAHPGEIRTYHSATDMLSAAGSVDNMIGARSAVNGDGSRIALWSFSDGLAIYDGNLLPVNVLPNLRGGLAIDPVREILYAVDSNSDEIVALGTDDGFASFAELFRLDIGEDVGGSNTMSTSDDGGLLFLSTPSGVRMFTNPIPEPSSLALCATGLLALGWFPRRRRSR
jgi:hypothetical protein